MTTNFQVLDSSKAGLNAKEGYVVVREGVVFLRILGREPAWELMTATAGEDEGSLHVCADRKRLMRAALRLCKELGLEAPQVRSDRARREYVKIARITRGLGETDEAFNADNDKVLGRFFEIFDGDESGDGVDELRELYTALAPDGHGEEAYMGDGMWLASDGSRRERGQ